MTIIEEEIREYKKKKNIKKMKILYNNHKNYIGLRKEYIKLLVEEGTKESTNEIKKVLSKVPFNHLSVDERVVLIILTAANGNIEEARALTDSFFLRKKLPLLGYLYKKEHKYEEAYACYEELLKNNDEQTISYCLNRMLEIKMLQGKYASALLLILNNMEICSQFLYYKETLLFLCKKLNVFIPDFNYEGSSKYATDLIIKYNKERVMGHIVMHKCHFLDKEEHSVFNRNIDICKLYEEAMTLCNKNNLSSNCCFDQYIIPYKNIGENGQDYLQVLMIPGTKKIITMYPVFESTLEITEEDKVLKIKF